MYNLIQISNLLQHGGCFVEKLILIPLFIVAFFTALFFIARNKQPRTSCNKGIKGKFWFAVAFFAIIFGCKPGGTATGNNDTKPELSGNSTKSNPQKGNSGNAGKVKVSGGSTSSSFSQKTPDLSQMKLHVKKIFKNASFNHDWRDPGIKPNLNKILHELGIFKNYVRVSCYDRMASPAQERSTELVQLQKKLLDKKVKAGILSVEQAQKIAGQGKQCNASAEKVKNYQLKIKRLVRLLYKNGELPSSIVNKLEKAINCQIINFSPAQQLVNDVTFHFSSLPYYPNTRTVLKILKKHKIINKTLNHRGLMQRGPGPVAPHQQKIKEFKALLNSSQPATLATDGNKVVKISQVPAFKRKYRLQVRKAVRALLKTKLTNGYNLKYIEKTLGVSILGKLEK